VVSADVSLLQAGVQVQDFSASAVRVETGKILQAISRPTEAAELIESFSKSAVANKVEPDDVTSKQLKEVNNTLNKWAITHIKKYDMSDRQLIQELADDVKACNNEYRPKKQHQKDYHKAVRKYGNNHKSCRRKLRNPYWYNIRAHPKDLGHCTIMDHIINNFRKPRCLDGSRCICPFSYHGNHDARKHSKWLPTRKNIPYDCAVDKYYPNAHYIGQEFRRDVDVWFTDVIHLAGLRQEWFKAHNRCRVAWREYQTLDVKCDKMQRNFETSYCHLREQVLAECKTYLGCYKSAKAAFNAAWPIIKENYLHRMVIQRAVRKVQCYIGVLVRDNKSPAKREAAFAYCQKTDTDVQWLIIPKPPLVAPVACYKLKTWPGHRDFKKTWYKHGDKTKFLDLEDINKCGSTEINVNAPTFAGWGCCRYAQWDQMYFRQVTQTRYGTGYVMSIGECKRQCTGMHNCIAAEVYEYNNKYFRTKFEHFHTNHRPEWDGEDYEHRYTNKNGKVKVLDWNRRWYGGDKDTRFTLAGINTDFRFWCLLFTAPHSFRKQFYSETDKFRLGCQTSAEKITNMCYIKRAEKKVTAEFTLRGDTGAEQGYITANGKKQIITEIGKKQKKYKRVLKHEAVFHLGFTNDGNFNGKDKNIRVKMLGDHDWDITFSRYWRSWRCVGYTRTEISDIIRKDLENTRCNSVRKGVMAWQGDYVVTY